MRKALLWTALLGLATILLCPQPGAAQKREYIELQRDVALLQEQVRDLQRSQEEKSALLRTLVEQTLDAVNRMQVTVSGLQKSFQEAQANTHTRVENLATQVQSLADGMDELRTRLGQISQQVAETRGVLETVDSRLAPFGPGEQETVARTPAGTPATQAPPSAEVLYSTALRDFIGGNYDLARQEFSDYLKYYGRTQLAGNAQFYIGDTYYQQQDYRAAIAEYDKVFQDYPKSYKTAAAHLKKGYALLELNQREAGVRQLRELIEKFPASEEAKMARARLERLGESASR